MTEKYLCEVCGKPHDQEKVNDMKYDTSKLKPFDLQRAKDGDPVCTRAGLPVDFLSFDGRERNIIGYIGLEIDVSSWYPDGAYIKGGECEDNLMMAPKTVTKWINIYATPGGGYREGILCDSQARAECSGKDDSNYVATVKIEWEE